MSNDVEILVLQENTADGENLKKILERHQHPVLVANDGESALAAMRQHKAEMVISAIRLPQMSGYELCRQIKADKNLQDTPVILLTSLSDPTDVIHGLECGADNFITKPYDERLLLSRIQYILLNRELRKSKRTRWEWRLLLADKRFLFQQNARRCLIS
jgi:DNA-binding response OmpR family regulator